MTAAIEIDNLTKDYEVGFWRKRKVRALDNLSLAVEEGEIFGFLGGNGAGKSTTMKLLMRLIFPTGGRARILGRDTEDISTHARIGYLPEHPYFYDYLTARARARARESGAKSHPSCAPPVFSSTHPPRRSTLRACLTSSGRTIAAWNSGRNRRSFASIKRD